MKIASWNVNSLKVRLPQVLDWLAVAQPDILCLQETKAVDAVFPYDDLKAMGWRHIHMAGMKGYNGVAILSKRPFAGCEVRDWCDKTDARHAIVGLRGGIELHNFYVPAGGDIPDPIGGGPDVYRACAARVRSQKPFSRRHATSSCNVSHVSTSPSSCNADTVIARGNPSGSCARLRNKRSAPA